MKGPEPVLREQEFRPQEPAAPVTPDAARMMAPREPLPSAQHGQMRGPYFPLVGEEAVDSGPASLRQVPDHPLLTTGPWMSISLLSNPGDTAFLSGLLLGDRRLLWGFQGCAQLHPPVTGDPATQAESESPLSPPAPRRLSPAPPLSNPYLAGLRGCQ